MSKAKIILATLSEKFEDDLEDLIDKHGLSGVVSALSDICYEKANHVRTNWQDEVLAKAWEKNAKVLDRVKVVPTH